MPRIVYKPAVHYCERLPLAQCEDNMIIQCEECGRYRVYINLNAGWFTITEEEAQERMLRAGLDADEIFRALNPVTDNIIPM